MPNLKFALQQDTRGQQAFVGRACGIGRAKGTLSVQVGGKGRMPKRRAGMRMGWLAKNVDFYMIAGVCTCNANIQDIAEIKFMPTL